MEPNKRGKFSGISDNMKEEIENALSEAMTDYDAPTYKGFKEMNSVQRLGDRIKNKFMAEEDAGYDKLLEGRESRVQKFSRGGDVRFSSNRGKTY